MQKKQQQQANKIKKKPQLWMKSKCLKHYILCYLKRDLHCSDKFSLEKPVSPHRKLTT